MARKMSKEERDNEEARKGVFEETGGWVTRGRAVKRERERERERAGPSRWALSRRRRQLMVPP
jgi:hypothetical protein